MKKIMMLFAVLLSLYGVRAQAVATVGTAVGSRGGKKSVARMLDSSGYPVSFNDDKPWKVFESTAVGVAIVVDEAGVAPKQGMLHQVCIGTAPVANWVQVYDSSSTAGLGITSVGMKLAPAFTPSTTLAQCFVINAQFVSGLAVELIIAGSGSQGHAYLYWRELGGYR